MHGVNFRIFPEDGGWGWKVLGPQGRVENQGVARSRAEAAAYVIRGAVLSVMPATDDLSVRGR